MRRPAFWIALALLSVAATFVGIRYFPQAFSIVALDITMDRGRALEEARAIAAREGLGPAQFREAASFAGDDEAQTFVELEGGGKAAFTRMLRDNLYAAYAWRVRHFQDGETNETTIRFTPDGRPYGFAEKLREDAPGAALDASTARAIAERTAAARWNVDLARFTLVEQGQERRPTGRVDHTFTYERGDATLNEGRYRLTLKVSGDRLTAVDHFIKIPEAFTRRYASMRSANDLIGIGSTVSLALLYVVGGIGVGLFFMMRRRWVLWRAAAIWGVVVGGLQTLASINEFPLVWMTYDTAVPRGTFIAQQAAFLVAGFVGFAVFFGLSFMAAETLSRRAFGHHPQLWRAWSRDAGPSVQILGRTVGGYLLVSVFFAYDVLLYVVMTRVFGWWSPAEALVHPDVLATYAPWLSAIANSFQAGFWEESLFRAVPIAGAALIGDRFGKRGLFIAIAFVVQALVFGAGHAPYPNQPAYARPVELIIPSIGFGLLYLYFGLLPGIVLHFTFDVVWFALPIFLAKAPGIWLQQVLVVAFTLVPLWVVFARRAQAGRWTELPADARNAAWTPAAAPAPPPAASPAPRAALGNRARVAWLCIGAASLAAIVALVVVRRSANPYGPLAVSRGVADGVAREELRKRGLTLTPKWRVMAVPDDGSGGAQQFVYETAGETRWRQLLDLYLPRPRWRVRVATFEGDVADRAEEWRIYVASGGEVRTVQHVLPEARPGASLDEAAARGRALAAVRQQYGLEPLQLNEVSARPAKQKARTDWTFTFQDGTIAPLPQGEPRIDVSLAGDEVASVSRYVHVPEEWQRRQRAWTTRNLIIQIAISIVFGGLLVAAAIGGMIAWSRHRYAPRVFLLAAATALAASIAGIANGWPALVANLPTTAPLQLEILGVLAVASVGLTLLAAVIGLAVGALPARLATLGRIADGDALPLAIAAGVFGAAAAAAAGAIRTPEWARYPAVDALGALIPILAVALDPVASFMTSMAIVLTAVIAVDRITRSWTSRKALGIAMLAAFGFLAGGVPAGSSAGPWLAAGLLMSTALVAVYLTLLRFDPTLVPLALGTMAAIRALGLAVERPFPGAAIAAALATLVVTGLAWWWFRLLRRMV
jgi:hypothetical protein